MERAPFRVTLLGYPPTGTKVAGRRRVMVPGSGANAAKWTDLGTVITRLGQDSEVRQTADPRFAKDTPNRKHATGHKPHEGRDRAIAGVTFAVDWFVGTGDFAHDGGSGSHHGGGHHGTFHHGGHHDGFGGGGHDGGGFGGHGGDGH